MDRITFITLGVKDLEKSREFYISLGFKWEDDGKPGIVTFETEGVHFALFPAEELAKDVNVNHPPSITDGFARVALAYNASSKEEVDELYVKVKRLGITPEYEPQYATTWNGYRFYFRDFDGHCWEVAY